MGRAPCCSKVGLHRGPWTAKEDALLTNFIQTNGEGNWRSLPKSAGLLRCGKSCRLRWMNYLRPDIKRGNINQDEEDLIIRLHSLLGNRWSLIAGRLPGRTDNEIKNYWNSHLSKKLKSQGVRVREAPPIAFPRSSKETRRRKQTKKGTTAVEEENVAAAIPKTQVHAPKPTRFIPSTPVNSSAIGASSQGTDHRIAEENRDDLTWPEFSQDQAGVFFDCNLRYEDRSLFENLYEEYSQLLSYGDEQMHFAPLPESLFV